MQNPPTRIVMEDLKLREVLTIEIEDTNEIRTLVKIDCPENSLPFVAGWLAKEFEKDDRHECKPLEPVVFEQPSFTVEIIGHGRMVQAHLIRRVSDRILESHLS